MTYLAILCFATAFLWQYHIVTAWDIQKSVKNILETLENPEEYEVVFPVVLASGTNTPMSRARRQVESNDVQTEHARAHNKHDKGDQRILESGSEQKLINNEGSKRHKKYVSENTDSGTKSETDMNKTQASSYTVKDTYKQSEQKNVVQRGRAGSNSGSVENKSVDQRKITNSDGKIENESFDTGPSVNKPHDVTIIEFKEWILEVKNNPVLLVRDGLEVEWVTNGRRELVGTTDSCKLQTGVVRGDVNSIVALTTCDNFPTDANGTGDMTGLIQVKGDSYFVQPLVPTAGLNHQHPHLVYRTKKNLKLQDDQDFGDATESRQASFTNGTKNDSCGADVGPKRSKRESYWRHNMTELKFSNTTLREEISSTEETYDVFLVEETEETPEHSRAIFEHIRKKLEREEAVGYFLDNNMETEGKRQHTD
jgi:hypothetical protein